MQIRSAKELEVYKKAYELAMQVFEISKRFPPEERWAQTSAIRQALTATPKALSPKPLPLTAYRHAQGLQPLAQSPECP